MNQVEIVLIEDDANDIELITRVMKKIDLADRFVVLRDGAEAVNVLIEQGGQASANGSIMPKVVLLDLKLPKVNGMEVLRRIRACERTRQIPVVILTSSNEERDIEAAYDLGANSYVTKPIKFEEFAKVVAELGMYWLMLNKPPAK